LTPHSFPLLGLISLQCHYRVRYHFGYTPRGLLDGVKLIDDETCRLADQNLDAPHLPTAHDPIRELDVTVIRLCPSAIRVGRHAFRISCARIALRSPSALICASSSVIMS